MSATDILRTAADVIEQRGQLRDKSDGERSMARAVRAFNTLTGSTLSELDGWLFMSVLKMARATAGKPHLDDWVDLAGYAALGAECVERQEIEHGEKQNTIELAANSREQAIREGKQFWIDGRGRIQSV